MKPKEVPAPRFFAKPAAWRAWLEKNHTKHTELWVGFWKVGTGKPSITWPQSVDEALCFGWIDGLRRGIDETCYMIRFTPRKATSIWSNVNLKRFDELAKQGLVSAAGRAAWEKRSAERSGIYAYEVLHAPLDRKVERALRAEARAWKWFQAQTPGYRRLAGHWPMRAKREETRERRLATLVDCCRKGEFIPPLIWSKDAPARGAKKLARARKGSTKR
jgi:uncharacterized protein YdeI (YjbR/CyaY-like superfamily)